MCRKVLFVVFVNLRVNKKNSLYGKCFSAFLQPAQHTPDFFLQSSRNNIFQCFCNNNNNINNKKGNTKNSCCWIKEWKKKVLYKYLHRKHIACTCRIFIFSSLILYCFSEMVKGLIKFLTILLHRCNFLLW